MRREIDEEYKQKEMMKKRGFKEEGGRLPAAFLESNSNTEIFNQDDSTN